MNLFRAQSVHSMVFNSESGAHCLPTLQKQVCDAELQRQTTRLQTITKKKEEFDNEYMDDPSGNFLCFMRGKTD